MMSTNGSSSEAAPGATMELTGARPLRVLIVEDRAADAALIVHALERDGFDLQWQRVETEIDYLEQLDDSLDVILADYSMPQFDASRALELLRASGLHVPLIIVSGSIGEEVAVAAMKEGATDYLLKDRLARLGQAVRQAIAQSKAQDARRQAEQKLLESEQRTRLILDSAYDAFVGMDDQGRIINWNSQAAATFGWTAGEIMGRMLVETIIPEASRAAHQAGLQQFLATGESPFLNRHLEITALRRDGAEFPVELIVWPVKIGQRFTFSAFVRDITLRKRAEAALRERTRSILLSADVGLALNRSDAIRDILQHCAQSLVDNLDAAFARIWTLNEEENVLELQASAGMYTHLDGPHSRVPVGALKIGLIAQERAPHLTNDVLHDERVSDHDWARREGMVAFAGYPLIVEDRLVGVMAMFARRELAQATLDAMASVANQIAAGIERKRAEQRLRTTQFSIDQISTAVLWADADAQLFDVNDAACRLTGRARGELLSLRLYDLTGAVTARDWTRISGELRQRGTLSFDSRLRRKGSSEVPVNISINWLQIDGRECSCTLVQDITERVAAEYAQERSELRFRAIFHQAFEFLALLDPEGIVLEANQPALELRDARLADVAGRPLWETPWFDDAPQAGERVRQALARAAKGEFVRDAIELDDRDGAPRTFDFSVKPVLNDAQQVELLTVEARDITEQKRLEEQFRQAQKMEAVGRLAGGVAHDFNNLLTIISGYSEVALDELLEGDPLREIVQEIGKAGARAAALTRQLLAFSRKQVLAPVVLDLNGLIANIEKMLRRLIGEDVALAFQPAADLWSVRVDPGQMEQVIMNIAINARDAMPQGGQLTIETANVVLDTQYAAEHPDAVAGEFVLLAISDTGCGMDRATQARIFEPFFTTKEPDKGTGLGLATVYGIVKQSGGHVAVYSEPGCGTTFKVYLPRECRGRAVQSSSAHAPRIEQGTETILLVEDEDGVRSLARLILSRYGYRVLEARNGDEALMIFERERDTIDLLATDVVMPNMSGRELAQRLTALAPQLKVLFLSGYMDDAIVRHGLVAANAPFLQKPFTPETLVQKVRDALDQPPE